MSLNPTVIDQGTKVKMIWTPDPACQGYRFYIDGAAVSRSFTPTQGSTTFAKPDANPHRYGIQKMDVVPPLEEVTFPAAPPPPGQWTQVAVEHGSFTLARQSDVRYGKNTSFVFKTLAAGTYVCNSTTFGSDPLPGTPKVCEVASGTTPPPDPPPTGKPLVGTISSGGTYTGTYNGTVAIRTTEPVIIDGGVGNIQIDAYNGPAAVDLTVRRCKITCADAWDSPRWLTAQNWKRLVIENNTIVNSRGIELWPNRQPNPTTIISKNKHTNPKGIGISPVGNFVQLRVIWGGPLDGGVNPNPGTIDISWNEIISVHNQSDAEDIISIFKTARTRVHDNLINGQSKPDSMSGSSQNSITIDPMGEPNLLYDNLIERNFVIDAYSIGMFGGNNNLFKDNYVVSDGYVGDTGQKMKYGYSGLFCSANGTGNRIETNHVGYINGTDHGSQRVDFQQDGGTWTGNVHIPDPLTRQTELDHIAMWRKRVSDAGITIGA